MADEGSDHSSAVKLGQRGQDGPFRRPISPTERLYFATRAITPPFAIGLVVEGVGAISVESVRVAVEEASRACPGARLVRDGDDWVDSGVTPSVVERPGCIDWDALDDDPVLQGPFAAGPEATVELVLLRALEGNRTTFVFRAFHGVMDAGGMWLWVEDVFRVLRGEQPRGARDPIADAELVARIGTSGAPTTLLPNRPSPFGRAAPDAGPKFLLRHRSIAARVPSVVARIAAVVANNCPTTARIMVPVDLRRYDADLRSTANLALPQFLELEPGASWTQANAQLLEGMMERRELNELDGSGLAKLPEMLTRSALRFTHSYGAYTGRNAMTAIVSHLGKVPIDDFAVADFQPVSARAIPNKTGLVPVSIAIIEHGECTEITLSARGGRAVAAQLDSLLDHIEGAVLGAVTLPASTPTAVPVRRADRRRDAGETVDAAFRRQVQLTPDAPAVLDGERTITYRELDARSDALAAALLRRGVARGNTVAVLADQSLVNVVAQLAIMKTGAAFFAVDRHQPAVRISEAIERVGAELTLTERRYADSLRSGDVAVLDDLLDAAESPSDEDRLALAQIHSDPLDIAYVATTSGTSGRCQFPTVTHAAVVNFSESAASWYRLGPSTRFAYSYSPASDLARIAFFGALLSGGALVLIPDENLPAARWRRLTDAAANTWVLTPALLAQAMDRGITPGGLAVVIVAGDRLSPSTLHAAREFFGPTVLLTNSYGSAETAMVCINHTDPQPTEENSVPIGEPAVATAVYLLGADGRPVAEGEAGELYIAGPQAPDEYVREPQRAATRVALIGSERAYRTGDLARVRANGALEYLGRVDEQVVVDGERIDPGAVQRVLDGVPTVAQCVVVAQKSRGDASPRLVAYVVPNAHGYDESSVRELLAASFDAVDVVTVSALPLNARGTLARSALPVPRTPVAAHELEGDSALRSTAEWATVAGIWSTLLHVNVSGLKENSEFFALGGDSVAAVEMLARVSRALVGPGSEAKFLAGVEGLNQSLTLGGVLTGALRVQDDLTRPG